MRVFAEAVEAERERVASTRRRDLNNAISPSALRSKTHEALEETTAFAVETDV